MVSHSLRPNEHLSRAGIWFVRAESGHADQWLRTARDRMKSATREALINLLFSGAS